MDYNTCTFSKRFHFSEDDDYDDGGGDDNDDELMKNLKSPEENYKINLSIFRNLEEKTHNKMLLGSQTLKQKLTTDVSMLNTDPHINPATTTSTTTNTTTTTSTTITNSSPNVKQVLHGNGKYYLRQSLYATLRMNPLKSFPMVFNSKLCPGVEHLNLQQADEEELRDNPEDEGKPESPSGNLNFFHGSYRQAKQNPSYLSDNEDEIKEDSFKTSPSLLQIVDKISDKASLTSDYDSVSSISNSENIEMSSSHQDFNNKIKSFHTNHLEQKCDENVLSSNHLVGNLQFNGTYNTNNNNNNNNNNDDNNITSINTIKVLKNDVDHSYINKASLLKCHTTKDHDFQWKSLNNSKNDDQSMPSFVTNYSQRPPDNSSQSSNHDFKTPEKEILNCELSFSLCPGAEGEAIDSGSEVVTLEKGEIISKERETLISIRHKARSSMICKRRVKLTSKAEDVAEEFRQKRTEENTELTGNKLQEITKTLKNLNICNFLDISNFIESKSSTQGIVQNIRVERKETEIHVVQQHHQHQQQQQQQHHHQHQQQQHQQQQQFQSTSSTNSHNNTTNDKSNNNKIDVVHTNIQPTPGSFTKEFSEIFLEANKLQIEINNIVCCETVQQNRSDSDVWKTKSSCKNDRNTTSLDDSSFQKISSSLPSSSSSLPSSSSPSSSTLENNIFKLTSVFLIKSTIIDMNSTHERRKIFQELSQQFSRNENRAPLTTPHNPPTFPYNQSTIINTTPHNPSTIIGTTPHSLCSIVPKTSVTNVDVYTSTYTSSNSLYSSIPDTSFHPSTHEIPSYPSTLEIPSCPSTHEIPSYPTTSLGSANPYHDQIEINESGITPVTSSKPGDRQKLRQEEFVVLLQRMKELSVVESALEG